MFELEPSTIYSPTGRCDKTAWFPLLYFMFGMAVSQAVVTLRFVAVSNLSHADRSLHA